MEICSDTATQDIAVSLSFSQHDDFWLRNMVKTGYFYHNMDDELENRPFTGLGGILERERISRKLSRAKLAELAGVSPSSLANWERAGKPDGKYPPIQKLVIIAKILNIDPRRIFQVVYTQEYKDLSKSKSYQFDYSFISHFASTIDFLNKKLKVKDVEDLNDELMQISYALFSIDNNLRKIGLPGIDENGPNHEDPGRPTKNPSTAVGAALNHQKEEDQT